MLKSISYQVTFPTTGRTFQNEIEFAPGLTTITGRNEAGKTLILEMISYALFGKAALRGAATDYKNLTAALHLEVNGEEWQITRARKEIFYIEGEVIAVGTDALNKEIPTRLGFGLDVWRIACAAMQGEVEEFTNMKPTARRQMVDRLINIDLLEAIERDCKAEAKTAEAVALSLMIQNVEPVEPVKPDGYKPSEEIEEALRICHAHEQERMRLSQVQEPVEPVAPDVVEGDVEELEAHEAQRQAVLQEAAHLQGQLSAIPEPTVTLDELDLATRYNAYCDELARRGEPFKWLAEALDEWEAIWDQKDRLRAGIIECPKCEHHFTPSDTSIDVAAIEALPEPPISRQEIAKDRVRHARWAEPIEHVEYDGDLGDPDLYRKEVLAHARAADRADVCDRLVSLQVPADRSGELRAVRAYRQELAVHCERLAAYHQSLADYREARRTLETMGDRAQELVALQLGVADARRYENDLAIYQRERSRFEDIVAQRVSMQAKCDGFRNGAEALKSVRTRVKQHLVPSLSQAASRLLAMMTDGERQQILVDEDFNIIVDGQLVNTLSGSGKSVVNLALRIGLGQVLTSSIMPVFLGDEIDAAMDADRAGSTLETMQNLKGYLKQIILITHKDLDADSIVRV